MTSTKPTTTHAAAKARPVPPDPEGEFSYGPRMFLEAFWAYALHKEMDLVNRAAAVAVRNHLMGLGASHPDAVEVLWQMGNLYGYPNEESLFSEAERIYGRRGEWR